MMFFSLCQMYIYINMHKMGGSEIIRRLICGTPHNQMGATYISHMYSMYDIHNVQYAIHKFACRQRQWYRRRRLGPGRCPWELLLFFYCGVCWWFCQQYCIDVRLFGLCKNSSWFWHSKTKITAWLSVVRVEIQPTPGFLWIDRKESFWSIWL